MHVVIFIVDLLANKAYKFYRGKLYTLNLSAGRPEETMAVIN